LNKYRLVAVPDDDKIISGRNLVFTVIFYKIFIIIYSFFAAALFKYPKGTFSVDRNYANICGQPTCKNIIKADRYV